MTRKPSLTYDPAPVIARCRAVARTVCAKLHVDAADDVTEIPVAISSSRRVKTKCGHFLSIAGDGLGRIECFEKMCPTPEYLEKVLLHEFAHAIAHYMRRGEPDPTGVHGRVFSYVMLTMGQEPSKYVLGASDGRAASTAFEQRRRKKVVDTGTGSR